MALVTLFFSQAPKKAKKRAEGANSNVFSMFEQAQIQEFKEVGLLWNLSPEQSTELGVGGMFL